MKTENNNLIFFNKKILKTIPKTKIVAVTKTKPKEMEFDIQTLSFKWLPTNKDILV